MGMGRRAPLSSGHQFMLAIWGFVFILARAACAQELGSLAWFKAQWDAAARVEIPQNVYIEYEVISPVVGGEGEIEQLRQIVEGKPDHPLRQRYESLQWQAEHGPPRIRHRLWYGDAKHWRLCHDFHQPSPLRYRDVAVRGREAWQLTERSLSLVDSSRPPADRDPENVLSSLPIFLQTWMFPGMTASSPLNFQPQSAAVAEDTWAGTTRSAAGDRVVELRGRVVNGRVQVEGSTMIQSLDRPEWTGWTSRFSDWAYDECLEHWVARSHASAGPDGTPGQVETLIQIRALRESELAVLLETPTPAGRDAVRGPSTFTAINDFRTGVRTDLGEAGATESPIPAWTQRRSPPAWLRPVGWLTAIGIVVALVWVRVRCKLHQNLKQGAEE